MPQRLEVYASPDERSTALPCGFAYENFALK